MDQKQVLKNGITYVNDSLDLAFDSFLDAELLAERMGQKISERMPLLKDCMVPLDDIELHQTISVKRIGVDLQKVKDILSLADFVEILTEVCEKEPGIAACGKSVLEKHGERCRLDLTGCLLYSIANNPLCHPVVEEIYEENSHVYREKLEEAKRYNMNFFAHFGVEEMICARHMAGILEFLRTEEGEGVKVLYERIIQMIMKGWPDIYRMLKQKTEVSYAFIYQIIKGVNGDRKLFLDRTVARTCITYLMLELLEIKKEKSLWVLLDYEAMDRMEQRFWKSSKEESNRKVCRMIRKRMEKNMPEIRRLVPMAVSCSRFDEQVVDQLRMLFRIGGLELDALYQTALTTEEVEKILHYSGISGEEEWEEYLYQMSVVALCKYVSHCKELLDRKLEEEETEGKKKQADRQKEKEGEIRKRMEEVQERLEHYKAEVARLKGMISECQRRYETGQRKNQNEQERWERERQELIALRNFVYQLQQGEAESGNGQAESQEEKPDDNVPEALKQASVLVFGGHDSWQSKMRQQFPEWRFVSAKQQTFDLKSMGRYQYLVINTNMFHHRTYYKIIAEKEDSQKIVYVTGSNVRRSVKQMAGQIC